jgi:hypothetical protein
MTRTKTDRGMAMSSTGMSGSPMGGMMPMMNPMAMMSPSMSSMPSMMPQMMGGMGSMGMMMPRCTMKMEKTSSGMSCMCVCDDKTSAMMMQNLCNMMAGGMCSMACVCNGTMCCMCNMTMGACMFEPMEMGMKMTCTSGDANCVKMIHACCDCMMTCMSMPGCCCMMMMNGMPVCCSMMM